MKKIIDQLSFVLFFTLMIIIVESCKKNDSSNTISNVPLIKKLDFTGTNEAHIDFLYDNNNRILKMYSFYGKRSGLLPPNDSMFSFSFFYLVNENSPYKVVFEKYQNAPNAPNTKDTHYLLYNDKKQVIKDSVIFSSKNSSFIYAVVNSFNNFPNYILSHHSNINMDDTLIVNNDNFVKRIDKHPQSTSIFNNYYYTDIYTYDNNINPLNQLNVSKVFFCLTPTGQYDPGKYWSIWTLSNRNNVLTKKSNGGSQDFTLSYQYKSDGLPTKRFWHSNINYSDIIDTLTYIYE